MLKIVVAPDSFKGSLSAKAVAKEIAAGIWDVVPDAQIYLMPVADGGEGTTECIMEAVGGNLFTKEVAGPMGNLVTGFFGILDNSNTAIIEVASASGLYLVPKENRNPLYASSYGTGELILAALDQGCREIFIGLGGSATNDAGAGILQALGARLLDSQGKEIGRGGIELSKLAEIDLTHLDQRLKQTKITVGCDVDNPLFGPNGASAIYGPQKGATPEMVEVLDQALENFANVAKKLNIDVACVPGAGAAGGIGAGLLLAGATITSGIEKILELTGLEKVLAGGIDLIVTGEGEFNNQSFHGKVPIGVARVAKKYQVPVIVLTGGIGDEIEEAYRLGIDGIMSIAPKPVSIDQSIQNAAIYLKDTASRMIRLIQIGQKILQ